MDEEKRQNILSHYFFFGLGSLPLGALTLRILMLLSRNYN